MSREKIIDDLSLLLNNGFEGIEYLIAVKEKQKMIREKK